MKFTKIEATGNDFIFLWRETDSETLRIDVAKLCHRNFGVGADGLIVLSPSGTDYKWTFFNSDGSGAEMCGNAARCATHFLLNLGHQGPLKINTETGYFVGVQGRQRSITVSYEIEFSEKMGEKEKSEREVADQKGFFVNTGVPHFLIEDREENPHFWLSQVYEKRKNLSKKIRSHTSFGSKGTNVTWFSRGEKELFVNTFERGVEDFTLSCGTGAVAAALITGTHTINTRGGKLFVTWQNQRITLEGPVRTVFDGVLSEEFLSP
jgi:diaminopimelate epimerase